MAYQQNEGWVGSAERLSNLFDTEPYTRPDHYNDLYHKCVASDSAALSGTIQDIEAISLWKYNAHDALWHFFCLIFHQASVKGINRATFPS